MIPVILKGDTAKGITLTLADGYTYGGCSLDFEYQGAARQFTDLVAGGTLTVDFTADETAGFLCGTHHATMAIVNAAGEVAMLPWAKIKVTDSPTEVRVAQITIDPATLLVEDATAADSLGTVKAKLNAVLAFLRGTSAALAICLLPFCGFGVGVDSAVLNDIPGTASVVTNVDLTASNSNLVQTIRGEITQAGGVTEAITNGLASIEYADATATNAAAAVSNALDTAKRDYDDKSLTRRGLPTSTNGGWFEVNGTKWEWAESATAGGAWYCPSMGWLYIKEDSGQYVFWIDSMDSLFQEFTIAAPYYTTTLHFSELTEGYLTIIGFVSDTLATIEDVAAATNTLAQTLVVTETDPTVSAWAKAASKPTYTAAEVGATDSEDVTAMIREQSLGGIWDSTLQVWWTPKMENGNLTYQATTNVNMNAGE